MTDDELRDRLVGYWFEKADDSIAAARLCLGAGLLAEAVNRAYYAAFYAAGAVLLQDRRQFRKHTGVQAAVHQHLVRPGRLEVPWGAVYDELFEARMHGDYDEFAEIQAEEAADLARKADDLVARLKQLVT